MRFQIIVPLKQNVGLFPIDSYEYKVVSKLQKLPKLQRKFISNSESIKKTPKCHKSFSAAISTADLMLNQNEK
jgi:hypothetical protein